MRPEPSATYAPGQRGRGPTAEMKFGAVLLCQAPVQSLVELAVRAEGLGFDYVWFNDNHLGHESCWPVLTLVAERTERIKIGTWVTNPGSREWTETASLFASLQEISNGRMVCGMGRGDAVRHLIGKRPSSVEDFEGALSVVKALVEGRSAMYNGISVQLKWTSGRSIEMAGAGYGPRVLAAIGRTCDSSVFQGADVDLFRWTREIVIDAAAQVGRVPGSIWAHAGAPAYVSDDVAHARDQVRWFGATVANHLAQVVRTHGDSILANDLLEFVVQRRQLDPTTRAVPGHRSASWVPDEIIDRFTIVGPSTQHIERLRRLESAGVDQFNVYLIHDGVDRTLSAYGEEILPSFRPVDGPL